MTLALQNSDERLRDVTHDAPARAGTLLKVTAALADAVSSEEVFAELYTGRCNNPAALITLQWLQLNRDRLRKQYPQWP